MKVRLTRKFADLINGIDLSKAHAGETRELSDREAGILLAEGWAEYAGRSSRATARTEMPRKSPPAGRSSKKR